MQSVQTLAINHWQIEPQENDFALLTLELNGANVLTSFEFANYCLQSSSTEQTLPIYLFQAPHNAKNCATLTLRFLTHLQPWQTLQTNCTEFVLRVEPLTNADKVFDFHLYQNQLFLSSEPAFQPAGALLFALAKAWQMQRKANPEYKTNALALMHSEQGFGFRVKPAKFMIAIQGSGAIGACPLLEDWQIPNRLATTSGDVGTLDGNLAELLSRWLANQPETQPPWQVWLIRTQNRGAKKGLINLQTFSDLTTLQDFDAVFNALSDE